MTERDVDEIKTGDADANQTDDADPNQTDDSSASDPGGSEANGSTDEVDAAELAARVELLAEENSRLRTEYARARRSRYRRTAVGLATVGLLGVIGGLLFPAGRDVLLALGATGVFGGVLTYYLSPGRFVAADVSERVYAAMAANHAAIADELGLRDDRVYLPGGDDASPTLFVPQRSDYALPTDRSRSILAEGRERGLALDPTGAPLYAEFERAVSGTPAGAADPLADQLSDALVEQFELARSATPDVDRADGRATVAVDESAFGSVDRFDHPIASFLGAGFATGLDRPVRLEVASGDDRADWLVTCRWSESADDPSEDASAAEVTYEESSAERSADA